MFDVELKNDYKTPMKRIVILGATGSLGKQTLELIKKHKKDFKVLALSSHENKELLDSQAKEFKVKHTVLSSQDGPEKLKKLCQLSEADIVVNVLSGVAGISPTVTTLKEGKILLLGNKESLIASGKKVDIKNIIPIDSEHNAIYEILKKYPEKKIKKIILPCSGGPFFGRKNLENISKAEALKHPKWQMGNKITIESATLLNKGLEFLEAHYLFDLPLSKIDSFIHPDCKIHGLVEFESESYVYVSNPDMKEHIENALLRSINKEPKNRIKKFNKNSYKIHKIDHKVFPGIKIVLKAFENKIDMKTFLHTEERIIKGFLKGNCTFSKIYEELNHYIDSKS